MHEKQGQLKNLLSSVVTTGRTTSVDPPDEPVPAEMLTLERLESLAEKLAEDDEVSLMPRAGISLHVQLRGNARVLRAAFETLRAEIRGGDLVTPAAAWLVENYYVVDEHIRAIRRDLPAGYYRQLPKLSNGALQGYPRVYGLTRAMVSHTDNRLDLLTLQRFCQAYQSHQALTIGELWAVAISLRIVLIDNLARLSAGIEYRLHLRQAANSLVDGDSTNLADLKRTMAGLGIGEGDTVPVALAAQLYQRIRQEPQHAPLLGWLNSALSAQATTADEIVRGEHQRQGAVNASIRNIVTSLKLIARLDWASFFKTVSVVDKLLAAGSAFASFDFRTQDLYRHAIEDLARGSLYTELDVASLALEATASVRSTIATLPSSRATDVGYHLFAEGRGALERRLKYRPAWYQRMPRIARHLGLPGYVGAIAVLSALAGAMFYALVSHWYSLSVVTILSSLLVFIAASDVATTVVNLWVTRHLSPQSIPGLELVDGVPEGLRTMIAVPVLLTDQTDIAELINTLEVHYLSSRDGEFLFCLLSDWADAAVESIPTDEPLLAEVESGIARLNRRYGSAGKTDRFFVLHRRRRWNAGERRWMGWERKRGKLHELNRWLLGHPGTEFVGVDGARRAAPTGVRYVISLDADTRLPRDAARTLVGKMAHPLNQPALDPATQRVIAGYGLLQPRVTPLLPTGLDASIFKAAFSGPSGIDPYAFAVSDVYQDLFGQGSYIGKGIYEVAAFEASLAGRVPTNQMLSHDLFEGVFARCGFASDVELVEEHPARYSVATAREHRWARGDWQLLPWIVGLRPGLTGLGRWKMLDNLRRTLVPPATLLALVIGWLVAAPRNWTLFVAALMVLPVIIPMFLRIAPQMSDFSRRSYLNATRGDLMTSFSMMSLQVTFWADRAWILTDAAVRTVIRLVRHRRLLEWTTMAQSQLRTASGLLGNFKRMRGAVLSCGVVAVTIVLFIRPIPWFAAPLLLLWMLSPLVAFWVSQPRSVTRMEPLNPAERRYFRKMARQTWDFFDRFVTAEHHSLPPDNLQEIPSSVVAHRTSPTNIGLYLLSVLCARDLGWIGTLEAIERLDATLATLSRLERFRGHLYNWYDTHDLRPLDPKYISTVDSGNLAGHLIAIAGACRQWRGETLFSPALSEGIEDSLTQLIDELTRLKLSKSFVADVSALVAAVSGAVQASSASLAAAALHRVAQLATELRRHLQIVELQSASEQADGLRLAGDKLIATIQSHLRDLTAATAGLEERLEGIARKSHEFALRMEFGFLLEPARELLTIGFRVAEQVQDPSCYDLLASEARLASFFAIAKGDLPVRHWFRLGRLMTPVARRSALVSWSGSMFEYLMPTLVLREPGGSVLGDTSRLIIQRQIAFGVERSLPWGVSESAFNARDREMTYQYSSFGVPGLGLQRGLGDESVIAPYATALAAMIDPRGAIDNFQVLESLGARGPYGWYDAMDFTPARVPEGQRVAPVRAYMAHHQGMVLVSIANLLNDGAIPNYFYADPLVQATELLLQERTPRDAERAEVMIETVHSAAALNEWAAATPRRFGSAHQASPRTHLLSNGNYSLMITSAGSGYSRWRDTAITRWREDPTGDGWGSYIYLRDVGTGGVWSAGYQPTGREPDDYQVSFYEDRAEFRRSDGPIQTFMEIIVSPAEDAEVRRVSLTNTGNRVRDIEVTSYMEIALAAPEADSAHPAFSKLFVQTQFVTNNGALLATRRQRESEAAELWVGHLSVVKEDAGGVLQYETDRAKFLGRGHGLRNAVSVLDPRPLSNTTGSVLDPILSLRRRVKIAPGETAQMAFWTVVAASRAGVLALLGKLSEWSSPERAKTLAWTQAQVQLRYLGIKFEQARLFQEIANHVLYSGTTLRAPLKLLNANVSGPTALWALSISGDLPIVLVQIDEEDDVEIVNLLVRAHEYWRFKRLAVDLVILNDRPPSYASGLQLAIDAAVRTAQAHEDHNGPRGGLFSLRADLIPAASVDLLKTVARVVLVASRGSLNEQLARLRDARTVDHTDSQRVALSSSKPAPRAMPRLDFFNGLGGFAKSGREYVTVLDEGGWTPAPWINVIANPNFGCQVSTDCAGTTWSLNARENQLTPWSNDPVSDLPSEVIYLRDHDSGEVWSATPLPIRAPGVSYTVRHGFGYTRFEHEAQGIEIDLLQFVPLVDPIKISRLRCVNKTGATRNLSITHFVDWVLGNQRSKTAAFIVTELDPVTGALMARNPWRTEFQDRIAFMDMGGVQTAYTADRTEFIGRDRGLDEPLAISGGNKLGKRVGGGLDPCGALQTVVSLKAGEAVELALVLGEAASRAAARELIEKYRKADLNQALEAVTDFWDETLNVIQVKTPDRSMDVMLNGWLLYQTLTCRVWARTGFYQSSGAYGFRDQLQDGMALCISQPALVRSHIIHAAGRQFAAGDVQHWWLPTSGVGVQTRIADDRVWLPFVVHQYLQVTADFTILEEKIPYLAGGPLPLGQDELFAAPQTGTVVETLFQHCARALNSSLMVGSHGLPLFGTGDWNDGMNRVGESGRGESVWMGWFLYATLMRFSLIADRHGAAPSAVLWRKHAHRLQQAIEREAWDGDWYRRGYFDDGSPLGSVSNDECRIDAIAQSWAVISGGAEQSRKVRAMAAVDAQLVSRGDGLVKLFTPAFDRSRQDPGYIKAYPPGVRENGGQYTHAAIWTTLAFAQLGDGDRARELFSIINPINHSSTRSSIHRYKVEPYVVCADVYSADGHVGRGGWTWYTGSAGWMYRVGIEGILGIQVQGASILIDPCIPHDWPGFEVTIRVGKSSYQITIENPLGICRGLAHARLDDREISVDPCEISRIDDDSHHLVVVTMGMPPEPLGPDSSVMKVDSAARVE